MASLAISRSPVYASSERHSFAPCSRYTRAKASPDAGVTIASCTTTTTSIQGVHGRKAFRSPALLLSPLRVPWRPSGLGRKQRADHRRDAPAELARRPDRQARARQDLVPIHPRERAVGGHFEMDIDGGLIEDPGHHLLGDERRREIRFWGQHGDLAIEALDLEPDPGTVPRGPRAPRPGRSTGAGTPQEPRSGQGTSTPWAANPIRGRVSRSAARRP